MSSFGLNTYYNDGGPESSKPKRRSMPALPAAANDNHAGPSLEWRGKWLWAHSYGAFDDDNGKCPRLLGALESAVEAKSSPLWDTLLADAANDNREAPAGQSMGRFPIMLRAKKGEFCPGAVEAIEWLETVLECAIADPTAVPSCSWLLTPEEMEAEYDEEADRSTIPEGFDLDVVPKYGPSPQWWAENGRRITDLRRARSVWDDEGNRTGRILAVTIAPKEQTKPTKKVKCAPRPFRVSPLEDIDRIRGEERPKEITPGPGQMKGENDPAIAWTRIMHRTGSSGAPLAPIPPAHYTAVAKRRIDDLLEKLGEEQFCVLVRAVLMRESAETIGIAPRVSHGRATARGVQIMEKAVAELVSYHFDKIVTYKESAKIGLARILK